MNGLGINRLHDRVVHIFTFGTASGTRRAPRMALTITDLKSVVSQIADGW